MAPVRLVSLLIGSSVSILLMLFPFVLGTQITSAGRIGLVILLLGISGSFVHGFGYTPEQTAWRLLFSPWMAWALVLCGGVILASPIYWP